MTTSQVQLLPDRLPLILLDNFVIFPLLTVTIKTSVAGDIEILSKSFEDAELVAIAATRENRSFDPRKCDSIHPVGTACRVTEIKRTDAGQIEAVLEGVCRISFLRLLPRGRQTWALIAACQEPGPTADSITQMLMESSLTLLREGCQAGLPLPERALELIDRISTPGYLADLITLYLEPPLAVQRQALARINPRDRLKLVHQLLYQRLKELEQHGKIDRPEGSPPPPRLPGNRSGDSPDNDEIAELKQRIEALELSPTSRKAVLKELDRLEKMNPASPDYHNILHYVELVAELPWNQVEEENLDLAKAEKFLDEDHYGLEKVKERILEHLAVRQLNRELKSPIICLVGPPGVGKTSLGKSVARAMGRKFVRLSLGGVHDEAEIRGHRRTYLGAMPGKIIQELKRAESRNPVFMLDEIDKLGHDFRGDPASALLEVMDPEHNHSFVDHYLNLPFDLSRVLFIATANQSDPIPAPLLDRMEIIRLPGYTAEEKKKIAWRYLIDRQRTEHGLAEEQITLTDEALDHLIDRYTREAGVRGLEKIIGRIMRRYARDKVSGRSLPKTVTRRALPELLGPEPHHKELAATRSQIGIVTGLAWTPTGGDILFIEAALMESEKGEGLVLTGSLGDVMKESAQTALSFLRSIAGECGIEKGFFEHHRLHIHIPSGAIPKDGPSAGLAIFLTLLSLATGVPAEHRIAVTGEISLSGRVLPVGGIKEKVLAARRAGIETVVLPRENLKNLEDLPREVETGMVFHGLGNMREAIPLLLPDLPPLAAKSTTGNATAPQPGLNPLPPAAPSESSTIC